MSWSGTFAPVVVLIVAIGVAWLVTRLAVLLLRRLFAGARPVPCRLPRPPLCHPYRDRHATFGQAEVHVEDGSSAIVQVRQTGDDG